MQTHGNVEGVTSRTRSLLRRHLILVLIFKMFFLLVLWFLLIKPYRVEVDSQLMSEHMGSSFQQSNKEKSHDRFDGR